MFITVDLASGTVGLAEPDDCKRFHVEVANGPSASSTRDAAAVADALGSVGRSGDDAEHVWIEIDSVRDLAQGRVGSGWAADFDAMLDFARSKEWLDSTGTAIQAHLEWA